MNVKHISKNDVNPVQRAVKKPSKYRLAIEKLKKELEKTEDGGAMIVESAYKDRPKTRRHIQRAAKELGYKISFRKYHRGGEYVMVNKSDTTKQESIHS